MTSSAPFACFVIGTSMESSQKGFLVPFSIFLSVEMQKIVCELDQTGPYRPRPVGGDQAHRPKRNQQTLKIIDDPESLSFDVYLPLKQDDRDV